MGQTKVPKGSQSDAVPMKKDDGALRQLIPSCPGSQEFAISAEMLVGSLDAIRASKQAQFRLVSQRPKIMPKLSETGADRRFGFATAQGRHHDSQAQSRATRV